METQPTDLPGQTLRIGGTRWYVSEKGSGPPLVLLHGYPLDHRLWHHQLHGLANRFRVIAPDLPGFGRTDLHSDVLLMSDAAARLALLLDELGLSEPVPVAGLSMGGYMALELWHQFRDRVSRLVLCDSKAAADTPEARANRLATADRALESGMEPIARAMLPKLLSRSTMEERAEVVELTRAMILDVAPASAAAALRGMAERSDFTDRLGDIACPVLCIVGSDDTLSTPEEMRRIAEAVPDGRIEVIAGAGHLAPLERPDAVNAAIGDFLRA